MRHLSDKLLPARHAWAKAALTLALLVLALPSRAARGGRSEFYQRYKSTPSGELMRLGRDYQSRLNKPDSALLFFTLVAGRYDPAMPGEEKRLVVDALNRSYLIYSLTLFDYPKAYDNLVRARAISKEMGEEGAGLYFNLGSMYQLAASQGRQAKLYAKALDCYRRAVRAGIRGRDQRTADMAFTNMTTLADVVGMMDSTRAEWDGYRRARWARQTVRRRYNLVLYEATRLKLAGRYKEAAEQYARLPGIVPDTRENSRFRALAYMEMAEVERIEGRYGRGLAMIAEAERVYRRHGVGDGLVSVWQTRAIFYSEMGRAADYDRAMYRYYQLNDSLKAYSLPSSVANMRLNEKLMELEGEMDGMKQRQERHRAWLAVAALAVAFLVILTLVVARENRELRRRNLALYQRVQEELRGGGLSPVRLKDAPGGGGGEGSPGGEGQPKYQGSALSAAEKERIARLVASEMGRTELIAEADFTIERLAQGIRTGQKYVSQVINETFGCNFATLLGRYRVREACRRFDDTARYGGWTIEAVARDLGFRSRSHFAQTFRKHTGLNPSEYLRMARERHGG